MTVGLTPEPATEWQRADGVHSMATLDGGIESGSGWDEALGCEIWLYYLDGMNLKFKSGLVLKIST